MSAFASVWILTIVESSPMAIVVFLLVYGGFALQRRHPKELAPRIRTSDFLVGLGAGSIITGTVRFLVMIVMGAATVDIGQELSGLLLFLIPSCASAFFFCSRMNQRAIPAKREGQPANTL